MCVAPKSLTNTNLRESFQSSGIVVVISVIVFTLFQLSFRLIYMSFIFPPFPPTFAPFWFYQTFFILSLCNYVRPANHFFPFHSRPAQQKKKKKGLCVPNPTTFIFLAIVSKWRQSGRLTNAPEWLAHGCAINWVNTEGRKNEKEGVEKKGKEKKDLPPLPHECGE